MNDRGKDEQSQDARNVLCRSLSNEIKAAFALFLLFFPFALKSNGGNASLESLEVLLVILLGMFVMFTIGVASSNRRMGPLMVLCMAPAELALVICLYGAVTAVLIIGAVLLLSWVMLLVVLWLILRRCPPNSAWSRKVMTWIEPQQTKFSPLGVAAFGLGVAIGCLRVAEASSNMHYVVPLSVFCLFLLRIVIWESISHTRI